MLGENMNTINANKSFVSNSEEVGVEVAFYYRRYTMW
jgi:hypothetical protein